MKQGESQRIYWQQWLGTNYTRRDIITSSAAIRINPDAAKAKDVTQLLRDTLKLSSLQSDDDDSLVLVGTLYSLPKDYVQFEHEPPLESTDPFHLIKTLRPEDNPLATRDRMMEQLKRLQDQAPSPSSTISPKIQWYFVPSKRTSPIPSCIELDGYCTTMEEEESEEEEEEEEGETDTQEGEEYYDWDLLLSRCPFLEEPKLCKPRKQVRRFFQLCQVPHSCSGFLLKQSSTDPHVWRKVHCVLTDDHLWYTTRVRYPSSPSTDSLRMGKSHGRIALARALLLEPNTEFTASPLFRVPHSFELVNSRGTSHLFRAPNRTLQQQWIQALTTKIMESFENSLLDQAELIVTEETMARNRRFSTVAVEPLVQSTDSSLYLSMIQSSVLRLGMDICEYRELCRHVQAILPAKQPIVAVESGTSAVQDRDAITLPQIQLAWESAAKLVDRAAHVALEVQQYVHHQTQRPISLSHSLETHCRHIDYVLTGQHRPLGSPKSEGEKQSPPPMDLFDLLLSELQSLVTK